MKAKTTVFVACFILIGFHVSIRAIETDGKCRGLALEGGGTNGAFQAGAIKGLIENQDKTESNWDVVSGVSAGSLNSIAFTMHPKGSEMDAVGVMYDIWHNFRQENVYNDWPFGIYVAWLLHSGTHDTRPFRKFLHSIVDGHDFHQRPVYMSTVDINHGRYTQNFNMNMTEYDEIVSAVMSSTAIPIKFPTIQFRDQVNIDGGAQMNLNMLAAINECRSKGFADEDIIIDAVLCYGSWPGKPSVFPTKGLHTLDLLKRYKQIYHDTNSSFWFAQAQTAYPNIKFRYFVHPLESLPPSPPGWNTLDFNQTHLREMLDIGERNAKKIIEMGPVSNFQKLVDTAMGYVPEM
mmetsp:Transcript_44932/g.51620  ORF Transcript_44932/g.51620 Transcript_44932/m.51620 type:complete len:348 (-) Transcript_44932:211-1254(-)